jgi:hypothetical protein
MEAKVHIQGFNGNLSPVVRILGIQVDNKLRWGLHIKATAAKATEQSAAVHWLAASTWGALFAKARQVYTTVVHPTITYRCVI